MRRSFFLPAVLSAVMAGLAASCTSTDPAPVFLDVTYQLRCIDCTPSVPDGPTRDIMHLDGEAGFKISCSVQSTGSAKRLTLDAQYNDAAHADQDFEFKIAQARIDVKDPGSSCEVHVLDASNTYLGNCTGGAPTADAPCQLTFKVDSGIVKGTIYCDNIPNPTFSPATTRYLVAPFTASDPAKFEIHGCSGL